jgi:hypothetical protein
MEELNFTRTVKCFASKMQQLFLCNNFNSMISPIGYSFDLSSKDFIH